MKFLNLLSSEFFRDVAVNVSLLMQDQSHMGAHSHLLTFNSALFVLFLNLRVINSLYSFLRRINSEYFKKIQIEIEHDWPVRANCTRARWRNWGILAADWLIAVSTLF